MQTSFIDSPVSVVNFSPNERVSDCVALEIETASRLWYVITLKLANLPTTFVPCTYLLSYTYLVQMFAQNLGQKLSDFLARLQSADEMVYNSMNSLNHAAFQNEAKQYIYFEKKIVLKNQRRAAQKDLKKRVPLYLGDRSQQIMSVVRHSKEALRSKTIMYKKETTTKQYTDYTEYALVFPL